MMDVWEKTPPVTLEAAVALATALRRAADEGEQRLMRYLRWLEGRDDLWRQTSEASFESFLKKVVGIQPSRYADARAALTTFGPELVDSMGLHGAIAATRVEEGKRSEAVSKVLAIREANGVPASAQNAHQVLANAHLLPPVGMSKAQRTLSRAADLERANVELRQQLAVAVRRAEEAEARAARYSEQLRAAGIRPQDGPSKRRKAA